MSMISSQIDALRRVAQTYRDFGMYEAERMALDAADTIWQLRDDLQQANAENAKLRKLVADLAICACGKYCYGCPHQYDGCDRDQRLRELGIEVDG